jgi:hypothetical protein
MPSAWVFRVDPKFYNVDDALRSLSEHTLLVQQHRKEICVNDKVYIWRSGLTPAIVGKGIVIEDPIDSEPDVQENDFLAQPLRFKGKRCRVRVRAAVLPAPLTQARMKSDPVLASWYLLDGLEGTNFRVSAEMDAALERLAVSVATGASAAAGDD